MNLDNHIHLLMLGDSVFDNGVYVPGEPDVSAQVKSHLERSFKSSKLTFHARDGAVMSDVKNQQIKNIPEDITHIALSIGGNDLLGLIQYLDQNRGDSFHQNLPEYSIDIKFHGNKNDFSHLSLLTVSKYLSIY